MLPSHAARGASPGWDAPASDRGSPHMQYITPPGSPPRVGARDVESPVLHPHDPEYAFSGAATSTSKTAPRRRRVLLLLALLLVVGVGAWLVLSGAGPAPVWRVGVNMEEVRAEERARRAWAAHEARGGVPRVDTARYTYWRNAQPCEWPAVPHAFTRVDVLRLPPPPLPGKQSRAEGVRAPSVRAHMHARNITRSAMLSHTDHVVVVSRWHASVVRLAQLVQAHVGTRVVVLVLDDVHAPRRQRAADTHTHVYVVGGAWTRRAEGGGAHVSTEAAAALIEVADLFVSLGGEHAPTALAMRTPTLVLWERASERGMWWRDDGHVMRRGSFGPMDDSEVAAQMVAALHRDTVDLAVHTYVGNTFGFARHAEQIVLALDRLGVDVVLEPYLHEHTAAQPNAWRQQVAARTLELVDYRQSRAHQPRDPTYYVGFLSPEEAPVREVPRAARKAKVTTLYTTFDTTRVPTQWPGWLNAFDHVVVPCSDAAEAFRVGGVRQPIAVVPVGIPVDDFPQLRRPVRPPFRFVMFADSGWDHKRGYDVVFEAFVREFANEPNVELLLKTASREPHVEALRQNAPDNVRFFTGHLTKNKLLTLLQMGDAFVLTSHGEGFGVLAREAMATGLPVLTSAFMAHEHVADAAHGFPLAHSLERVEPHEVVGSVLVTAHRAGAGGEGGQSGAWRAQRDWGAWAHVSHEEVQRAMREAARDHAGTHARGQRAAEWIREHETIDHTAEALTHHATPGLFSRFAALQDMY